MSEGKRDQSHQSINASGAPRTRRVCSVADAKLVDDPVKRRLLHAFRHARSATRRMVLQMLEASTTLRT